MKEKFKLMNTKEKMVSCQGNKHVIRLSSGAIINADIYNVEEIFDRLQKIICETSKAEAKAEHRAEVAERALKECSKYLSAFAKAFGHRETEDQIYETLMNKAEKDLSEDEE